VHCDEQETELFAPDSSGRFARGDVVDLAEFCAKPGSQCHTVGKDNRRFGRQRSQAPVTAWNVATGFSRSALTSDNGEYSILALPAGEYKVTVEFSGFGKQTKNISLQVGQAAELGFTLSPGEVVQRVEVEATSELAEPTRTQVSTVITENQIVNLPVNGREFIDFALLSPPSP